MHPFAFLAITCLSEVSWGLLLWSITDKLVTSLWWRVLNPINLGADYPAFGLFVLCLTLGHFTRYLATFGKNTLVYAASDTYALLALLRWVNPGSSAAFYLIVLAMSFAQGEIARRMTIPNAQWYRHVISNPPNPAVVFEWSPLISKCIPVAVVNFSFYVNSLNVFEIPLCAIALSVMTMVASALVDYGAPHQEANAADVKVSDATPQATTDEVGKVGDVPQLGATIEDEEAGETRLQGAEAENKEAVEASVLDATGEGAEIGDTPTQEASTAASSERTLGWMNGAFSAIKDFYAPAQEEKAAEAEVSSVPNDPPAQAAIIEDGVPDQDGAIHDGELADAPAVDATLGGGKPPQGGTSHGGEVDDASGHDAKLPGGEGDGTQSQEAKLAASSRDAPSKDLLKYRFPIDYGVSMGALAFLTVWLFDCSPAILHVVGDSANPILVLLCPALGIAFAEIVPPLFHATAFILVICCCLLQNLSSNTRLSFYSAAMLALFSVPALLIQTPPLPCIWAGFTAGVGGFTFVVLTALYLGTIIGSSPAGGLVWGRQPLLLTITAALTFCPAISAAYMSGWIGAWRTSVASRHGVASGPLQRIRDAWDKPSSPRAQSFIFGLIVIALVGINFAFSLTRAEPKDDLNLSGEFRVGAFNIQQGFDIHGEQNSVCVRDIIKKAGADVVGFQEIDAFHLFSGNRDPLGFMAKSLDGDFQRAPAGLDGGVGLALWSKGKLEPSPYLEYFELQRSSSSPVLNRFVQGVRVPVGGRYVHVFTIHPEWFSGDEKLTQKQVEEAAKIVTSIAGDEPAILTGDFNLYPCGWNPSDPGADTFDSLRSRGFVSATSTETRDVLDDEGNRHCIGNVTTILPIGKSIVAGAQLDYIWYTNDSLEMINFSVPSVDGFICSDHLPLFVDFKLRNNKEAPWPQLQTASPDFLEVASRAILARQKHGVASIVKHSSRLLRRQAESGNKNMRSMPAMLHASP